MTAIAENQSKDLYNLTPGQTAKALPEKTSQRQLHIRRAIEDRNEVKRLESMSEDTYWDNI